MSDDETDMPALQSVSDSDSEFSHTEDEYEFEFPCSDSNETFEDRMRKLEGIFSKHGRMVRPRSRQIGDLLAEGARALLEFLQPYPGDERVPSDDPRRDQARFEVSRVSADDYLIWDEFFHEFIVLPERLLREPNFELAAWYAARLGSQLGIPRSGKPKPIHRIRIDDLLALGSEMYLTELGAHEPDTRDLCLFTAERGEAAPSII